MRRHVRCQGGKPTLGRWTAIRVLTLSSGQAGGNAALQRGPDLMLANAVCCRSPNSDSRCVSID